MTTLRTDLAELEGGTAALAEELLGPDPERKQAAEELAVAKARLDAAEERTDSAVAALEIVGEKLLDATGTARQRLVRQRADLAGEVLHAPADVLAAAEPFVAALIAWAPQVHHAATVRATALNRELGPLEVQRTDLREKLNSLGGVSLEMAERFREAGFPVTLAEAGENEDRRLQLEKQLGERIEQVEELRLRRAAFADLAGAAKRSLVCRFGEAQNGESLFRPNGPNEWLSGVRHRTAVQVARFTGTANALKPIGHL